MTSTPVYVANTGSAYQYQVQATDPDAGDRLTYQLLSVPAGVTGITIDSTTGLLTWNNPVAGNYRIVVGAVDDGGLGAAQGFNLTARVNNAPFIRSNPVLTATPGSAYAYDVIAADVDGDRLTYTLDQASRDKGITLDILGRLRWNPTVSNIGTHRIVLTVSDGIVSTPQEYDLAVAADTEAPLVRLIANYDTVNQGETVIFQAKATDNIRVAGLQLLVNGNAVVLDTNGMARFTPTTAGTIFAQAIATDTAGNIGQATFDVAVIDTSDLNAPEVSLNLGAIAGSLVTAPIDIRGSISDDGQLDYYRLLVAPVAGGEFREILFVDNPSAIANGVLGKFDPSLLQNDSYILRLEVADNGGNISYSEEVVDVAGELKLGNFRLSFTDLTVPVTGIPITLTRTYDTLTSGITDDFGYGWRMEFRDTDLRTSLRSPSEEEQLLGYQSAFKDGTRVYITLPGGKREAFTFRPTVDPIFGLASAIGGVNSTVYKPAFVGDKGVTSTLTVKSARILRKDGTDEYVGLNGGLNYNPADVNFGNVYVLTTKEGIVYEIDAQTGDLLTVTDTNGNKLTYTDDGIYSSSGKQVTFERDAQGRIAAVKDPMGELIRYTYDAKGDLVSVTDREGNTTKMEYNQQRSHYLDKIIDPLNRSGIRNEYGDDGRLKEIVDVNGQKVEMSYDPSNSRQTVLDQLGHATIYEYDTRGNILTEIDAEGQITKRKYDDDNNVLEETVISDRSGPNGFTTKYTYDNKNNLLTQEDALGNVTRNTYGAYSRLLTQTDALGRTSINVYDSYGNLSASKDALGKVTSYGYDGDGQLTSVTDANKQTTRFDYDSNGNVTQVTDALGNVTKYTYNRNGDKLTETRYMTLANGQVRELLTRWTYDDNGRMRTMTDAENHTTTYEYDANGKQIAIIDALQHRTEYKYNERGELVETIYADNTPDNPFDNLRDISRYDAAGRTIATIDKAGRETRFVYDDVGRLFETIVPDNTPSNWDDNPRTRIEYYTDGLVKAQIDERGNRTEFRYDAAGRQIEVIYADDTPNTLNDNPRTTYKYDKAGQRIAQTDAFNHTTTFKYDDLGRLTRTEFNDKTYTTSEYDNLGRRIAMTDQNDKRTEYRYDTLGRLTGVKNALQDWTEYSYNEVGNLIWIEDANDHRTEYEYDGVGRRTAVILPMDQRSDSVYDAVGNLKTYTDFNRNTITYSYNPMNWMTSKQFQDGSKVTYAYTTVGLQDIITFVDANGQTTATYDYDYDERDRLVKRTDNIAGVSRSISYTYDAASNRTSVTTASGTVNYTFDVRNRLDQVIEDGSVTADYDYDAVSNLVRTTFANGTQEIRQYDDLYHLKYLENRKGDTVFSSYTYTLDKVGNRTKVVEHNGRTVDYAYDALYRLTQEKITDAVNGDHIYDYTFDKVGNRLTKNETVNGTTTITNYAYDANDRLLNETVNQQVVVNYTYDHNGNTLTKTENGITTEYTWDYENQLIAARVKDANGATQQSMQYRYNDSGIRVTSTVNGVETRYLIDEMQPYAQVLEEYSPNSSVQVEYVYGNDLIAQEQSNSRTFYHVDGLGSTRVLTNEQGTVVNTYDYEAYGKLINSTGGVENKYLFAGEQFDQALGDYYNRARYYDADTGRFTRKDDYEGRIAEVLTLHKYIYAHNNPVNSVDPTGLFTMGEMAAADTIRNVLAGMQTDNGGKLVLATLRGDYTPGDFLEDSAIAIGLLLAAPVIYGSLIVSSNFIARYANSLSRLTSKTLSSRGLIRIGTCDECAQVLKAELTKYNIPGRHIRLETTAGKKGVFGRIAYGDIEEPISTDGFHEAIVVRMGNKDIVYDNLNPKGIAYEEWMSKFEVFPGNGNRLEIVRNEPFS
ncbi:RHS repeat-associated core domain-containing protein [Nostoc sp. FACHB-190]|uniref:RHS repeat-associated core domain-containing protein n=1 Tax=Nostoc sp. FACHB-190 TaxID=2692838 RepID=UPI0037C5DF84